MRSKVLVLTIFITLVISLMSFAIYMKNRNDKKVIQNSNDAQVQGLSDFSAYPVIQNIAPSNAYVGLLYRYDLGIMDSDTHYANIKVSIEDGPSWLTVEGLSLSGTPTEMDIKTSKVTTKVSDGEHSTYNTFYILVSLPDESE